jgi:hypothetical protein
VINYAHILKEMNHREEIVKICGIYLKDNPEDPEIRKLFEETGLSFIENN